MKLKTTLIASAIAATAASSAQAQTVIDITGSTAGRTAVHTQILNLLSGTTLAWNGGSSASGATRVIYKGTFNTQPVIIRTYWSGSAAAVRDVSNSVPLNNSYFATSTDTTSGPAPTGLQINSPSLAPASNDSISEIGFSDVFQSSTEFTTNPLVQQDAVGVIPFKFFRNDGSNPALTNMTPGLFRALYGNLGELQLSLFTGNAAHANVTVFAAGRDNLSGTRITALAETGAGVFSSVNQYQGTVDSNGAIGSLTFVGDSGYNSGGLVATLLGGTYAGGPIVSYLGASDWSNAVSGGAVELSFNGVTLGADSDKIRNGQYTFWGYLHQSSLSLSGTTASFYDSLRNALLASPGNGLILINTMNVERAADGSPVTPK